MKFVKKHFIEIIISLLLFAAFMSKGIFNLLFFSLVLTTIYKVYRTKDIYKEKIFFWYLVLIGLGIISNLLNSGTRGISKFLDSERSLLYVLVFVLLNLSLKQFERTKNWILIGGISSALYSGISYFTPQFLGITTVYKEYQKTHKMPSFQNGIRWARLLQIMVVFSFFNLEKMKKKVYKLGFVVLAVYFVWNIIINGQRAAILGAIISMLVFFFMYVFSLKKDKLTYIITIIILTIALGISVSHENKMLKERVISIFDINKNISNRVRLGYWKIGIDMLEESHYLGIGSGQIGDGNSKGEFKKFIAQKPKKYQKKYYQNHEGTPFENNYINLAVENGLIYLVYLIIIQGFILVKIFKNYLETEDRDKKIKLMSIFSILVGDRVFMFFYPRTDSYVEFIIVFLMFYGYKLGEERDDENEHSLDFNRGNTAD